MPEDQFCRLNNVRW